MKHAPALDAILDTAPIFTEPAGETGAPVPVEIHHLLARHNCLSALWSLKSFFHAAGVRYPLTLHCQGAFSRDDVALLESHFPNARIVSQSDADEQVEAWLAEKHWECLRAARRNDFLLMKIIDFYFLSAARHILAFDSDVLFFRKPAELLVTDRTALAYQYFQRDCSDSYTLSIHRAIRELGIFLLPHLNTGIMLYARNAVNLAYYEELVQHPALREFHWHREQTLRALAACATKQARYLPASYVLAMQATTEPGTWVARHYVTPVRNLFVEEGIARLMQLGVNA